MSEYVSTGQPVGSATVLRLRNLQVSSATVRNDMSALEEGGFIQHPHTSAGRVPSELGYRYYVESLMDELDLSSDDKMMIRHQFHQVELDVDEWAHLAATVLARSVRNAALVTRPHLSLTRLKQAHFVGIHDRFVLVLLVFQEGGVKQQIFPVDEVVSASELTRLSNWLTTEGAGLTARELHERLSTRGQTEAWAATLVVRMMQQVDERGRDDIHVEGLRYVLQQRDFGDQDQVAQVVETLEDRGSFAPILNDVFESGGVRIIIGRENQPQALQHLSLILARYGSPDDMVGAIGVVGPTRMAYDRILPAVRYLVKVLDDLVSEFHS